MNEGSFFPQITSVGGWCSRSDAWLHEVKRGDRGTRKTTVGSEQTSG